MNVAKISRAQETGPDLGQLRQWTSELVGVKKTIKDLGTRQTTITKRIKAVVQEEGYVDDQGHVWLDFDEPVDGVVALQMQRKVSKPLNEDKAEAILRKNGLYEECTTTVVVLDQDAIMAAHYAGKISEDDIDAMFPPSISYALMTPTAK
jgi:hypothetical protein